MTEPGRGQPNLYIDYRGVKDDWPSPYTDMHPGIIDPYSVDILQTARAFAAGKASPRFALLRVWTHSHFLPLMLGWNNRGMMSFEDEVKRSKSQTALI